MFIEALPALCWAAVFTAAYFWVRREWVFRTRLRMHVDGVDLSTVPSFNEMLFLRWWVWSRAGLMRRT